MQPHAPHPQLDLAIVILAGGRATRFPGKLEAPLDGEPLLARVYHHVRDIAPTMIAGRDTFSGTLDALLDCPIVVDRWPDRGPLGGLLSAAHETSRFAHLCTRRRRAARDCGHRANAG